VFHSSLVLAALLAAAGPPLVVSDDAGAAISAAHVDFVDARGNRDPETTDAAGRALPRDGFEAVAAVVDKPGFVRARIDLAGNLRRVVLERALPTIGRVTVATGTAENLHQLPLAASVLDRTTIALAPAASSDRVLRNLPGFDRARSNSGFTNYGQLRASFTGAGNDRGVVLVDGIPAQDAFGGQIDWQAYPGDEIERAELLRGAGSALYGSGGVGGVLNIATFAPRTGAGVTPDGGITVGAGSNDYADDAFRYRAAIGPTVGASLSAVSTGLAYRDLAPGYSSPIDHVAVSRSGVVAPRLRYDDGKTTLEGAGIFASDHQDEGRPNYTFDRALRQESGAIGRRIGDGLARFTYYNRDTTVHNLSDLFPTKPGALRYVQDVPTNENGFFGTYAQSAGPAQLELRVDQRRVVGSSVQNGPTGRLQASGMGTELEQGIALQATVTHKRFEGLVGVRADRLRYDDLALVNVTASPKPSAKAQTVPGHDDGAISPRAALRYDIGSRLAVRIASGGGFRGPYLNELVRGFNIGAVVEAPNPELVPERSTTSSGGLDYLIGTGRLSFDVIQTRVNDAIAFVTQRKNLMVRENLDRTQTDGETLTYAQPLGTCTRLRFAGTTQNARVTSGPPGTVGKALSYVPSRVVSVGIDAAERGPFAFSVDGSYVGQTYADDIQQQPLGAALLFGATVRARTASGTTFTIVADNITNAPYLSSIDRYGPPLTVGVRVALPLGQAMQRSSTCSI